MMNPLHFRRHAYALLFSSLCILTAYAQPEKPGAPGRRPHRDRSFTMFSDSASASSAEYMLHIESTFQKLDSIQNESELRPDVFVNAQALKAGDSIIYFVDNSLRRYGRT